MVEAASPTAKAKANGKRNSMMWQQQDSMYEAELEDEEFFE